MRDVDWKDQFHYFMYLLASHAKLIEVQLVLWVVFFGLVMTEELCWRVHIASLVECIFMRRSERELLVLDTFLSLHVLVLIFPSGALYFTLFIIQQLFRTCYCIGFRCPDFFQTVISPMLFCFLGNFLFLTLDGRQSSTLVLFKTILKFKTQKIL